MNCCFGIIGSYRNHELEKWIIDDSCYRFPIPNGHLFYYDNVTFIKQKNNFLSFIKNNTNFNYIFTLGCFNSADNQEVLKFYFDFSCDLHICPCSAILCSNTYFLLKNDVESFSEEKRSPFIHCKLLKYTNIDSPFGLLNDGKIWYSRENVKLVQSNKVVSAMTSGEEINFWFTVSGFLYMARHFMHISTYTPKPKRFIIFSRMNLLEWEFIKLIFTFDKMNFDLFFVNEDDFNEFQSKNNINHFSIFSFVGNWSFVKKHDDLYLSSDKNVVKTISDSHDLLQSQSFVCNGFDKFKSRFCDYLKKFGKSNCEIAANKAIGLFREFNKHSPEEQKNIGLFFTNKWRSI